MEKLTNDQMENLVGGGEDVGGGTYCTTAYLLLFGGGFEGTDEAYLILYNTWAANCPR